MDDGRMGASEGSAVASAVEAVPGMVVGDGGVGDGVVRVFGERAVGDVLGVGVSVGAEAECVARLSIGMSAMDELEAWLRIDGWGVELGGCMSEESDVMGLADGVRAGTVDRGCSIVATVVGC
jgi:hypothetical protein